MKLVESPDGSEMHIVHSLDGYGGWAVLKEECTPPKKWERWNGSDFVEDPDEKAKVDAQSQVSDNGALLTLITELEARVAELEANLANNLPL